MAKERGCGTRVKGGIYAEVPLSPFGMPLEDFLLDPPVAVDAQQLGLSPIGVTPGVRDGVCHVFDWVGSQHYPNVADFVEETRRMGISRRLPKTFDFTSLSPESRLILLHSRALIENFEQVQVPEGPEFHCPKDVEDHYYSVDDGHLTAPCVGLWWKDVRGGEEADAATPGLVQVKRHMPWGQYAGCHTAVDLDYRLAIFGSFPLHHITVIEDPDTGAHEEAVERASRAGGIPVTVESE